MKYLILAPEDGRVLHISDDIGYQENGNYLINGGMLAIPPTICHMVEVEQVPTGVEPERYCYVDGEFIINEDWVEPDAMTPDEIMDILDGGDA